MPYDEAGNYYEEDTGYGITPDTSYSGQEEDSSGGGYSYTPAELATMEGLGDQGGGYGEGATSIPEIDNSLLEQFKRGDDQDPYAEPGTYWFNQDGNYQVGNDPFQETMDWSLKWNKPATDYGNYLGDYPGNDADFRINIARGEILAQIELDMQRISQDWVKLRHQVSQDYQGSLEDLRGKMLTMVEAGETLGTSEVASTTDSLKYSSGMSLLGGWKGMGTAIDTLRTRWEDMYDPTFAQGEYFGTVFDRPDYESYKPGLDLNV